jgi:hypothetical protein
MRTTPILLTGLLLAGAALRAATPADDERKALQFFENDVRPLLAGKCYECHGEKKQKAGLRLDSRADALKGGETGPALVPGKPQESLLIEAVHYTDENLQMPPKEQLAPEEIATLEKWIALGAPWPAEQAPRKARAERDADGFTAEDRAYWAFQPLARPVPPALAGNRWVRGDIDRFVAAKHAELGLAPAPEADRHEFVRRIYFDLHGLPPTRAQIDAFVGDRRPDAYERLTDELLASPRYGERWAQHWLDLVRYAESDGYRADALRPGAWPYRDYVIKSFNADKPYDVFVREQLAGDEIAFENPDVLIATSYLRAPVYEWNQRDVRGQANLIVDDITNNVSEVFLGLSMGCARCHDHKFDAILQKDYFALRAFFEGVLWRTDLKLGTPEQLAAHAAQQAQWEAATAEVRRKIEELTGPALKKNVDLAHSRFTDDIKTMMAKRADERDPYEHILAVMSERQLEHERVEFDPMKALRAAEAKQRYRELEAELKKFDHLKPKPLTPAFVATDAGATAPTTVMKLRKGERPVGPAYLTILKPDEPKITPRPDSTGRRTALAEWLTQPEHPLTTRVIVNRVWQYHFGRGLAGVPNDLGRLGEAPTHPELLDWLARRFTAQGWSVKALHREIVLSATYRQTTRVPVAGKAALVDPTNKYLWRFTPRRLDAEQARDAILAVSGELDTTAAGGPSQDAGTSARRSVYTVKRRNNPNEMLASLDAPAGFTSIAERQNTSTPAQALMFMNGDWILNRARKLAAKTTTVEAAWETILSRAPTAEETAQARAFLEKRAAAPMKATPVKSAPVVAAAEAKQAPAASGATPAGASAAAGSGPAAAYSTAASVASAPTAAGGAGFFQENSKLERLVAKAAEREGDEFTVEAVVRLESVDSGSAVRTIVSRWNGAKGSLESHGWALGVTGAKSAYKPLNLILQITGEDENMNTSYEVVASDLRLALRTPYYVAARVSCSDHTVTFYVQDLSKPGAKPETATLKHGVVGKLGTGQATPVIGGVTAKRGTGGFHGTIEAVRIAAGGAAADRIGPDLARWKGGTLAWDAKRAPDAKMFEAIAGAPVEIESADPRQRAMADLCHVLLNSNEFLFLH